MIRLAVVGPDATVHALTGRLHGATVDLSGPDVPSSCTAVAFLDPAEPPTERALRCLDAGKHVLLLAGPWLSDIALGRLSAAAREAGTRLAVLNPERFLPSRRLIREELDSGHLGVPGLVRMHRWANSPGSEGDLPTTLMLDLDIALWLMGEPPDRVYAVEARHPQATGPQCCPLQIHLGFPSGGMALIDFVERGLDEDSYQSLSLIGSKGAAYADDHQNMQLLYGRHGPPQALRVGEDTTALVALVRSFVTEVLATDADLTESGSPWTKVLEIARAARGSLASRQAVELAP